MLIVSLVVEVL